MAFTPLRAGVDLGEALAEELNLEEVFSFQIGSLTVSVDEATVVSWIIIVAMSVLALLLTRKLKVTGDISRRQALLELAYEKAEGFFKGLMGDKLDGFIPWLMSVALFIGVSNIIGLFGMKPPTKSMQVTAALALTSIVLVEFAGYKYKGFKGRLKGFTEPIWVITPINIMEVFTKPLSLCMRLFGNVLAAFTIMELIKIVTRAIHIPGIPVAFSLYFDIFDGLLQAYIFVFLTALYLSEAVEQPGPKEKKPKKKKQKKAKQA